MIKKDMFADGRKWTFEKAAALKRQPTEAEDILWSYLRNKPLGFKFRRQHVYAIWVLDFYCHALQFAIEVDGSVHDIEEVKQADNRRQKELENCGLKFLRLTNDEVKFNFEEVKQKIEKYILNDSQPNIKKH